MVGTLANSLNNLKRANKSGAQFAPLAKSHHSPGGRNLQEHHVPNCKLKQTMAAVGIALLAALCYKQSLSNQENLLVALLHKL